jgi:hypothetical protein
LDGEFADLGSGGGGILVIRRDQRQSEEAKAA